MHFLSVWAWELGTQCFQEVWKHVLAVGVSQRWVLLVGAILQTGEQGLSHPAAVGSGEHRNEEAKDGQPGSLLGLGKSRATCLCCGTGKVVALGCPYRGRERPSQQRWRGPGKAVPGNGGSWLGLFQRGWERRAGSDGCEQERTLQLGTGKCCSETEGTDGGCPGEVKGTEQDYSGEMEGMGFPFW